MKRLLLAVIVALVVPAAFAADGDVLITPDGTVYSIAVQPSEDGLSSSLAVTVDAGGKSIHSIIPDSMIGLNTLPNLAYDADSKSLFVVWMRMPNPTSSELVIANYLNGKWFQVATIDSRPVVRSNLGIHFTRQLQILQFDGTYKMTPALILHAAWWEKGARGESAHYAAMPLSRGLLSDPDIHELAEFVNGADAPAAASDKPTPVHEFFKQVSLLDGPSPDTVDAVFTANGGNFYRTTLRPVAEVRIHITVGAHGPKVGGPKQLSVPWDGHSATIASPDGSTLIFTNTTDEKVSWVMERDGKWYDVQELKLNDKMTVTTAMAALTKMAALSNQ